MLSNAYTGVANYFSNNIDVLRNFTATTGITGYLQRSLGLKSGKEEFEEETPAISKDVSGRTFASTFGNIFADTSGQDTSGSIFGRIFADTSGQDISGSKEAAIYAANKTSQAAQEITAYTAEYASVAITYGFLILWWIFCILIGSLVANHLIYYPQYIRLFAFSFIMLLGYLSDFSQMNLV